MTAQLHQAAAKAPPPWSSGGSTVSVALATQTLVIFAIRTRRIPFLRSRPSRPLVLAVAGVVLIGGILPFSPLSHLLGFQALPGGFFAALAGMVVAYLALIEVAKRVFFANPAGRLPMPRRRSRTHHLQRRASRFTYPGRSRPQPHG